jgi:hypothetical protein
VVPSLLTGPMNQGSNVSFVRTPMPEQGQTALPRRALRPASEDNHPTVVVDLASSVR